jgi:hypothetical protein
MSRGTVNFVITFEKVMGLFNLQFCICKGLACRGFKRTLTSTVLSCCHPKLVSDVSMSFYFPTLNNVQKHRRSTIIYMPRPASDIRKQERGCPADKHTRTSLSILSLSRASKIRFDNSLQNRWCSPFRKVGQQYASARILICSPLVRSVLTTIPILNFAAQQYPFRRPCGRLACRPYCRRNESASHQHGTH